LSCWSSFTTRTLPRGLVRWGQILTFFPLSGRRVFCKNYSTALAKFLQS
jgi:hypothetical protein